MSLIVLNIIRFVSFVFLQVALFDHLDIFGFIEPYPYLLFILMYSTHTNRYQFLLASFFLGLTIDVFHDSGAVHAVSSLILAYIRPRLLRFSFGLSYQYHNVKVGDRINREQLLFILIAILIHHLVLFVLDSMSLSPRTLGVYLFCSVLTFLYCILIIFLIKQNK